MKRRSFLKLSAGAAAAAMLPAARGETMKERIMKLEPLSMAPFETTMMGVMKGALDFHGIPCSGPSLFALSGHAFLINIHKDLCPSGPYCWASDRMAPLLRNLGVQVESLGFFGNASKPDEREAVERKLKDALDRRIPCSLLNMEHQLITGYDDTGFLTAQPWPRKDYPPARLTAGTWKEFGNEIHVTFYTLRKAESVAFKTALLAALDYAADLAANPKRHTSPNYGIGPDAYVNWIAAVPKGGGSHGNWWNATVWSECRQMAADFFRELPATLPVTADAAASLAKQYADIAGLLKQVSDKAKPNEQKVDWLTQARDREAEAVNGLAALAAALRI